MTELIVIDNPNKLPKTPLSMCETLEEAEKICDGNPDHVIYGLYHIALDYTTYFTPVAENENL